jgi:hypothetical protein
VGHHLGWHRGDTPNGDSNPTLSSTHGQRLYLCDVTLTLYVESEYYGKYSSTRKAGTASNADKVNGILRQLYPYIYPCRYSQNDKRKPQ